MAIFDDGSPIEWLIRANALTRTMRERAYEAIQILTEDDSRSKDAKRIAEIIDQTLETLKMLLPTGSSSMPVSNFERHLYFAQLQDFKDMIRSDIPTVEANIEKIAIKIARANPILDFSSLLDPSIVEVSAKLYQIGDYHAAALKASLAVLELIRKRTGLTIDGDGLITRAFSPTAPLLEVANVKEENGKSEQRGFMHLCQGMVAFIRNPKAHGLVHDLDSTTGAQMLVFLSALIRNIKKAKLMPGATP